MGTPRVHTRYDVHCMDCGESYEERYVPEKCTFKRCKSENIFVEENSKYTLSKLFTTVDDDGSYHQPQETRGFDYHALHIPNEWSI